MAVWIDVDSMKTRIDCMNPPASVQLLTVNQTKTIKTAGRAVIMHWLQYHYFSNSWICQQATCTAACYGVSVRIHGMLDVRRPTMRCTSQETAVKTCRRRGRTESRYETPHCSSLPTHRSVTNDFWCLMPATHAQEKRVPETCASRLVTETCTCIGQSATSIVL